MIDVVASVLYELILYRLFYWPGWLILRVLTLWRYPPASPKPHNRLFVSAVPVALLFVVVTVRYV